MTTYLKPFFRPEDFAQETQRSRADCEEIAQIAEAKLEAAFGNEYQIVMFWKEKLEEERRETERLREALRAVVEAARKALEDVTWHARSDCLPALHIAEKTIRELDRIAGEGGR